MTPLKGFVKSILIAGATVVIVGLWASPAHAQIYPEIGVLYPDYGAPSCITADNPELACFGIGGYGDNFTRYFYCALACNGRESVDRADCEQIQDPTIKATCLGYAQDRAMACLNNCQ